MKTLLLIVSLFATQAHAFDMTGAEFLPVLGKVSLEMTQPPGMAAVQPQGLINFSYASCAARQFAAEVTEENNILFVKVVDQMAFDCMGPETIRSYSVQFTADAGANPKMILVNPQTINVIKFL